MRRILAIAVVVVGAVGAWPANAGAQQQVPVDIFATPVFWVPFRSDFRAYGTHVEVEHRTPQAGVQLGLRYGDLTFGVSGLFLAESEQLRNNTPGEEFSDTFYFYRYDIDYTGAYTFRDVIRNFLNVSLGVTLFTVYIDGFDVCEGCAQDSGNIRDREFQFAWAVGPPLGLTFKLTDRLFLAINTTPAWGESNIRSQSTSSSDPVFFLRNDVSFRYLFSDTLSAFVGWKTQYASQHNAHDYLAHGPIFGLTFRFNVR